MEDNHGDSCSCREEKLVFSNGLMSNDNINDPAEVLKLTKVTKTDIKSMKPPRPSINYDLKNVRFVESDSKRRRSLTPEKNIDSTDQELQNALFILNNRYTSTKLELEALRGTRKKQKPSSSRILASTFLKKRKNSLQNESP